MGFVCQRNASRIRFVKLLSGRRRDGVVSVGRGFTFAICAFESGAGFAELSASREEGVGRRRLLQRSAAGWCHHGASDQKALVIGESTSDLEIGESRNSL